MRTTRPRTTSAPAAAVPAVEYVAALLICAVLAGCGGGSSGGDDVGGDGVGTGAGNADVVLDDDESSPGVDGDSTLSTGEPSNVPLSDARARAFGIDVAELNDALHFLGVVLPADVVATDESCAGGGTRTSADDGDGRRAAFTDCVSMASAAVRLGGDAALVPDGENAEARRLELDELTVRSGTRSVSVNGSLRLLIDGERLTVELAGDSIVVDDSQGELELSALRATMPSTGFAGEATFAYTVASSRAGESASVRTDGPLVFDGTAGCPTGGTLELTFADARQLRLEGAPGGNVGLTGDFGDDTLACTEIGRLVPAASGFVPPPRPGG